MISSYNILDKLENFSDKDIIQFYHNAYTTECMSLGHYKGQMNRDAKVGYAIELNKRGFIKIPKVEGFFNGDGTS
tara:strand:+ start:292 stop:516 length:225 start_codon:yes stop_codon:yes gene_type:complete